MGRPVTTYRIFGATNGPVTQDSDSDNYTMGVEFYVTSAAWLTEIRFWAATTVTGSDHAARLYTVIDGSSGTLMSAASTALPSPLQAGWNTATLTTPVALTPNQRYKAAVYFTTDNGYTGTGGYWSTGPGAAGLTTGILVAPSAANATGAQQGTFSGGTDTYPALQFNSGNYWVDVTVTDVAPGPAVPVVDAGADITITLGQTLTRTATATGTPTSWAWTITAGPAGVSSTIGTAAALSWTPTSPGTYVLSVTATNATGTSDPDTLTVTVLAPPPPPGRSFGSAFFAA